VELLVSGLTQVEGCSRDQVGRGKVGCGGAFKGGSEDEYQANFEWMMPGFSCQSLILTHILCRTSSATTTHRTIAHKPEHFTNLPKRTQPRQDAPSNPSTVLTLRRRPDLDPHVLDG